MEKRTDVLKRITDNQLAIIIEKLKSNSSSIIVKIPFRPAERTIQILHQNGYVINIQDSENSFIDLEEKW